LKIKSQLVIQEIIKMNKIKDEGQLNELAFLLGFKYAAEGRKRISPAMGPVRAKERSRASLLSRKPRLKSRPVE